MSLQKYNDNRILIDNIKKTIAAGQLAHAIIIEADEFFNKLAFAKDIVKALVCKNKPAEGCDFCIDCRKVDDDNYEDMLIVDKGKDSIKKEDVEDIQEFLKRKASLDNGNIVIVCSADNLIVQSQNKLLKTLEEPSKGSRIILLSENTENFLDTVKSRSVIYRLSSTKVLEDNKMMALSKEMVAALREDSYFHNTKKIMGKHLKDKGEIVAVLDGMEKIYRDFLFDSTQESRLYRKEDIFTNIRYIEEAKKDIRGNVSPATAFKSLAIKIGG